MPAAPASLSLVSSAPDLSPHSFPEQMAALRRRRGLSLRGLARSAGVSHDALGAWERGERLPRLPELEAALAALGVSPAERLCLIALVPAPRALRHVRTAAKTAGPLPGGGDLLRAMRGRRGLTQTDAARLAGISQGRLACWERSEDWPTAERLHRLCYALGAHPQETAALTGARGVLPAWGEEEEAEAWSYKGPPSPFDPLGWLLHRVYMKPDDLRDLRSLSLERSLWLRAQKGEALRFHLYSVYAYRARALLEEGRFSEVGPYADRSWDLARQGYGNSEFWAWGVIASAAALRRGVTGRRSQPAAAAALLASLMTVEQPRENWAWMLSELALAWADAGLADEAIRASIQALDLAERAPEPSELLFRRRDHAAALVALGRPGEALVTLDTASGLFQYGADPIARHHLLTAKCYLKLGNTEAAQSSLAIVLALIEQHGMSDRPLSSLRPQAEALAAHL